VLNTSLLHSEYRFRIKVVRNLAPLVGFAVGVCIGVEVLVVRSSE
jgi:hypothetical protein